MIYLIQDLRQQLNMTCCICRKMMGQYISIKNTMLIQGTTASCPVGYPWETQDIDKQLLVGMGPTPNGVLNLDTC
jgi:hypothetical protein